MNVKKSFMRFTNHLVGFVRFILDIPKNMKNVRKIQLRRAFLTSFAVLIRYHDKTLSYVKQLLNRNASLKLNS